MKKSKPLTKEKIFVLNIKYPMTLSKFPEGEPTEKYIVFLSDVKSAAELVLKEIEKEIEKHKKKGKKADEEYDWRAREHELGIAYGLKFSKNLIKKAFEGIE